MVMVQRAGAYARGANLILHAEALSTAGVGLHVLPVVMLPVTSPAPQVGATITTVVLAYRNDHPHPVDWKAFGAPFLRAAGVKSWRALHTESRHCSIEKTPSVILLRPSRNGGVAGDDKGFHALEDHTITVDSNCTHEVLGAALLSALAQCR